MKVKEIESHDMNLEDDEMCLSKPVRNLEQLTNELIEALETLEKTELGFTDNGVVDEALNLVSRYNEGGENE